MIVHFIATALFMFGVHASTRNGMIFNVGKLYLFLAKALKINYKIVDKIFKVLFDCSPCMSSFYGTVAFFLLYTDYIYLPVWVFCLCGFNFILNKQINK